MEVIPSNIFTFQTSDSPNSITFLLDEEYIAQSHILSLVTRDRKNNMNISHIQIPNITAHSDVFRYIFKFILRSCDTFEIDEDCELDINELLSVLSYLYPGTLCILTQKIFEVILYNSNTYDLVYTTEEEPLLLNIPDGYEKYPLEELRNLGRYIRKFPKKRILIEYSPKYYYIPPEILNHPCHEYFNCIYESTRKYIALEYLCDNCEIITTEMKRIFLRVCISYFITVMRNIPNVLKDKRFINCFLMLIEKLKTYSGVYAEEEYEKQKQAISEAERLGHYIGYNGDRRIDFYISIYSEIDFCREINYCPRLRRFLECVTNIRSKYVIERIKGEFIILNNFYDDFDNHGYDDYRDIADFNYLEYINAI